MVSLELARCNFFVGKLTKVCSCMMGCSKFTRAFGPRKRSPPPPPRKNFLGIHLPAKSKQKSSFINLALKRTQPLFNHKYSLSKHSHDKEYSSIRPTIAFEIVQCYAKPVYYLSPFMIGLHRPYYYYHPMFGYIAPPPPHNVLIFLN